jgi:nucleoside 2-deoxyribosyltransferase
MDGRAIDEGACFELGYAYSRGKICIGLKTDVRRLLPIGDNPMVECALRAIFGDMDEVSTWIRERRWERH